MNINIHVRMLIWNDYEQNIIKVKNNNTNEMSDVMSSILEMLWLNNEQYFMDWTILMIR